jgi:hypothetical protein
MGFNNMQPLTCQIGLAEHTTVEANAKEVYEIRQYPSFSQHALRQIAGLSHSSVYYILGARSLADSD